MAKLRHIALVVKDEEKSSKFYEEAFGFKRVASANGPEVAAAFLSDGVMSLALLRFKGEKALQNREGFVDHFGVHVDNLDDAVKQVEQAGGKFFFDLWDGDLNQFERKYKDPDGIVVDLSPTSWTGTPEHQPKS